MRGLPLLGAEGHRMDVAAWLRGLGLELAAHESPRTTKPHDRTKERLTQDEVKRIRL
jgi:hypothetical protein